MALRIPQRSAVRLASLSRSTTHIPASSLRIPLLPNHPPRTPRTIPIRWHSAPATNTKIYTFDQIQSLTEKPSPDRILIDVREPAELADGTIPTAINIPIASQADALLLSPEDFEDRFGFGKPELETEVVFYCKAGVRSSAAAQVARQAGYERVGEYRGSWVDWVGKGGRVER